MSRWEDKALAAWQAWIVVTGSPPPNENALYLFLAQAQHETWCGDAWDASHNWGACDLRTLNAAEKEAFANGTLKVGMWLYPDGSYGYEHRKDSIGTIRGDSDPNTGAFKVWFYAAPTDVEGAVYMLRAGVRGARQVLLDPECEPFTYAKALYVLCCYYGGFNPGARACGHRPDPLNDAENKNIAAYAKACADLLPGIQTPLKDWKTPGLYAQVNDTFVENVTDNAGDEIFQASFAEDELPRLVPAEWLAKNPFRGRRNPDAVVT